MVLLALHAVFVLGNFPGTPPVDARVTPPSSVPGNTELPARHGKLSPALRSAQHPPREIVVVSAEGTVLPERPLPGMRRTGIYGRLSRFELDEAFDRTRLELLARRGDVVHVQPNYRFRLQQAVPRGWARENARVAEAWARVGRTCVTVAVIDTGIDLTHPDLAPSLWCNPREIAGNGVDDDHNGFVDDVHGWDFVEGDPEPQDTYGHGTHCAGIIGAVPRPEQHVAGVAPGCRLMAVRAFRDGAEEADVFVVAAAIEYAVRAGAKVVNCSWAGPEGGVALERAIELADQLGALIVAPAGNGGDDGIQDDLELRPLYPASYPYENLLTVSALEDPSRFPGGEPRLGTYANYGSISVDLAAPGGPIWSTDVREPGYRWREGTSVAAAFASGAAALIWEEAGDNPRAVKACLLASARPVEALEHACVARGTLDLGRACASVSRDEQVTVRGVLMLLAPAPGGAGPRAVLETPGGVFGIDCSGDPGLRARLGACHDRTVEVTGRLLADEADVTRRGTLVVASIRLVGREF